MPAEISIVLTDAPAVVALKREFRALCEREEELKGTEACPLREAALVVVRARKARIGREIFNHGLHG